MQQHYCLVFQEPRKFEFLSACSQTQNSASIWSHFVTWIPIALIVYIFTPVVSCAFLLILMLLYAKQWRTRMWADAQCDGRPAEYWWRPLLIAAVWLTPTARAPCSNAANIGERKTGTQSEFSAWQNSVKGQQPRKCIYSVPAQETAKHRAKFGCTVERRRCSNEAKTRNVEICWGAPNPPTNLSRLLAEVYHIVRTCGGDIAV